MSSFEDVRVLLHKLPGLGYRSAERIALHLLIEAPETLPAADEAKTDTDTEIIE